MVCTGVSSDYILVLTINELRISEFSGRIKSEYLSDSHGILTFKMYNFFGQKKSDNNALNYKSFTADCSLFDGFRFERTGNCKRKFHECP